MQNFQAKQAGKKNVKPMISKLVIQGLDTLLSAIDLEMIAQEANGIKAYDYLVALAAYYKSDEYAAKSAKALKLTNEWKAKKKA